MTPQQREAAMRLADELQRFDGAERESLRDEAAALLRELAAAQGEHQQHWCTYCRGVNAHNCQFNPNVPRMQTYATTSTAPLYSHSPQQRKPLSEEQIYAAISDQVFWATSKNFIVRVVRDVEAAHGITGGKE